MYFMKKELLKGLGERIIALGIIVVFFGLAPMHGFAKQTRITYWKAPQIENPQEQVRILLDQFEKEHPNIRVEYEVTSWIGWEEKHMSAYAAEEPPDVCFMSGDHFRPFAQAGYLVALNEAFPEYANEVKAVFHQELLDEITFKGNIMGVPLHIHGLNMFYNKSLFKQAGLDSNKPPKSWKEVVEYGQKIVETETAKYGIIWVTQPLRQAGVHWQTFLFSAGGHILSEDLLHSKLNEPAGVKALQFATDLYSKYHIAPPPAQYGLAEAPNFFYRQEAAMLIYEAPAGLRLIKTFPEGSWDYVHWPGPEGVKEKEQYNLGWTGYNCISEPSKHKEAAFELVKFLGSAAAIKFFCARTGWPSPRKDIRAWEDNPYVEDNPQLVEFLKKSAALVPYYKPCPRTIHIHRVHHLMGEAVSAALVGEKSPQEALDEAARKMEKFLTGE